MKIVFHYLQVLKNKKYVAYILILFLCFLFYGNTIGNQYSEDDWRVTSDYSRRNLAVEKGLNGIFEIFTSNYTNLEEVGIVYGYRPLARSTFAIGWALWGQNPHVEHFVNLLLYALLCMLIFKVLLQLFGFENYFILFLATLIFLMHPIHVEVVASLKNREELLSILFAFAAFYCINKLFIHDKVIFFIPALIFLLIALISKENAIMYMVVYAFTIRFIWLSSKKQATILDNTFLRVLIMIVFLSMAIITHHYKMYFLLSTSIIATVLLWLPLKWKWHFLSAIFIFNTLAIITQIPNLINETSAGQYFWANPLFADNTTLFMRAELIAKTYLFYLKQLLLPLSFAFYYGYNTLPIKDTWADPQGLFSIIIFTGLMLLAIKKYTTTKLLSWSIFFFLVMLLPFSNILPVPGIIAERYAFAASLGFAIVLAYYLNALYHYIQTQYKKLVPVYSIIVLTLGIFYYSKTSARNQDWFSYQTLYDADIPHLENSAKANSMVGHFYLRKIALTEDKNLQAAYRLKGINYLERALKVYPTYPEVLNMLGNIALNEGKLFEARNYFYKNIQSNPDYLLSYGNIASTFANAGFLDSSKIYLNIAIDKEPLYPNHYINLAKVYLLASDTNNAMNILIKGSEKIKNPTIEKMREQLINSKRKITFEAY